MTDDKPTTRRDLMKPVQLLGLAFGAALFAGVVTLMSMGFFQESAGDELQRALLTALVIAGISFISVLLISSLLLLAIDPAEFSKPLDRPVLIPEEDPKNPDAAPAGEADTDPKA